MTDMPETTLPTARTARRRWLVRGFAPVALAAAFALAGCAADTEAPTEPNGSTVESDAPANETPEGDEPAATVLGTATVGGTSYDITELRNCEPLNQDAVESSLELQGFGETADGERVQIDVYIQTIGGTPLDVVSWSGPEGVFGTQDHADVQLADNRVSGSATMVDSFTLEEELAIEYDLAVPNELIDCR
ncbi:hypothetical protein [Microcella sp.]|uniref:hypothetical protein n=1 Tax=Microcella sp. TaxID=1913979 RepID=UPI0025641AD9|nr:hypothetical protein [Microcella sp.]MBX9471060.1 hypothetical protein [Microcella sp.]